jgi:phospholipid/cholesterol/gamma-HCH transport system substrate-binding protein
MKKNRPVIVGIFILIGLAILVVTIFTLGGQKKSFVKSFVIHAIFNDVGGLVKGGNVWFSGVKIGIVKSIELYRNSQVEVLMSIEKSAQPHIHKNAMVKIGTDGLIGNRIVIIYGGDSTIAQVEANGFLLAEGKSVTDEMLQTLQANNKNLLAITEHFKSISKKIDIGQGALAALINDPHLANTLNSTVNELAITAANFKTTSLSSVQVLNDLKSFSNKINTPSNSINQLVTDTAMFADIKNTITQLKDASRSVKVFTENLSITGQKLNQNDNIAGTLLNDSIAANKVKIILKNLETSSQKLDEDLEALQHNFLLRGYFRKKQKINNGK